VCVIWRLWSRLSFVKSRKVEAGREEGGYQGGTLHVEYAE